MKYWLSWMPCRAKKAWTRRSFFRRSRRRWPRPRASAMRVTLTRASRFIAVPEPTARAGRRGGGEQIVNLYKDRAGEMVTGVVKRLERGDAIVDLGNAEALLSKSTMIPREGLRPRERIS